MLWSPQKHSAWKCLYKNSYELWTGLFLQKNSPLQTGKKNSCRALCSSLLKPVPATCVGACSNPRLPHCLYTCTLDSTLVCAENEFQSTSAAVSTVRLARPIKCEICPGRPMRIFYAVTSYQLIADVTQWRHHSWSPMSTTQLFRCVTWTF